MSLDIWQLLAGLMLFLLAMSLIEDAIRAVAGNRLKDFIARNTHTAARGILSGTLATAVLQSSSLVGLLVLAFVGANIMRLKNALLIIFGANLGTTATGWLVTMIGFKFDLQAVSMPLIALGGLVWVIAADRRFGHYGRFVLGVGLLLLALQFMKGAVADAESIVAIDFFENLSAWQFLLFGVLFTAIVQSSSAAMVITLSALNTGMLDLYDAAAVVIGADLGTTTTVMLGAIRGNANKKRVALGHVLFNVATDTLAFVLLVPLVAVVAALADPLLSLVAFHSLFNLLGIALCTPFVGRLALFLEHRFVSQDATVCRFLDPSLHAAREVAITALYKEVDHLSQRVIVQNASLFPVDQEDVPTKAGFRNRYMDTKRLEAEILEFALDLDVRDASQSERESVERFLTAARNLLLSSKLCKDNIDDLGELAEYQPGLYKQIVNMQAGFYRKLGDRPGLVHPQALDQIEAIIGLAHDGHDLIHQRIYALIQSDELPLHKVSTVLNVNRALSNSNLTLLAAIASLAGAQTQMQRAA